MSTSVAGQVGVYTGRQLSPNNFVINNQTLRLAPSFYIVDGNQCRDPDNTPTSLIRCGMMLGKITSAGSDAVAPQIGAYANSVIGITTAPLGDAQTTLNVTPQAAAELVRRIGSNGTFTLTGEPYFGAPARSFPVVYSAVNATTGAVTITATGSGSVSGVNAVEAIPFVDSTGSGTFTLTIEGTTTPAITYSATAATLVTNINGGLNAAFGTSAIVASGASLAAQILTFSGTGYTDRPIANSSNGTVSGVKVIVTLLAGATGFTAGNNPVSSGVGAALAGGSTTTTAGVIPVTGTGGEFVLGSGIGATDGSQVPNTVYVGSEWGVDDVGSFSANPSNINQPMQKFAIGADCYASQVINLTTGSAGFQAFLKASLRATGGPWTFDNDR